jgi:hypothetical protein
MAQELTFTRFAELMLARTYEREKRNRPKTGGPKMVGPTVFIAASEVMADVAPHVPDHWFWEAAQYLDEQGLVNASIMDSGDAFLKMTGRGRVFVEQEEGTGVIREYRKQDQFVVVLGDGNQVAVGHGQTVQQRGSFSAEEAVELLDQADQRLQASDLPEVERADALADVETIRTQVKKEKPNVAVIRTTLAALGAIDVVADLAEKLGNVIH